VAELSAGERRARLAELATGFGANVQRGQTVLVSGDIADHELLCAVAEACYEAGAVHVETTYVDLYLKRARVLHGGDDAIGFAPEWDFHRARSAIDAGVAQISMVGGTDPAILEGLDPDRLGRDRSPVGREWLRGVSDRLINWTILPSPSPAWAAVVHPDLDQGAALERLWEQIERACRLDEDDPVAAWRERMATLRATAARLSERHFDALQFEGPGTDLTIGLLPSSRFVGGGAETASGIVHHPNVPTEEVFTSPDPARADGVVRSTTPLDVAGTLISGLEVRFDGGRAVSFEADQGGDMLRARSGIDDGGSHLGEVALVDAQSRVGRLGTVFYETLLDENAASHIALGAGFDYCVGDEDRDRLNRSEIHIDFMIGSDEVDVTGVTAEGERVPVLRGGAWQI
jgi:aminopeptidase